MRTLDEVIAYFDNQTQQRHVYLTEDAEDIYNDALHYLKEFKRISARIEKIALGNITETLEKLDNPALTWDELKAMDGKPVWATFDNENGTWYIAKVYDDEVVLYEWGQEFGERISGAWDYTPKRWQAYRKEKHDQRRSSRSS